MFITFEGGEGTGKSTQIRLLGDRLRANGFDVVVTREPGGTESAEAVRRLLVSGETNRWSPNAEALLNYAARDSHLREVIRPALAQNKHVICDRFIDSTIVYQGIAGGVSPNFLDLLEREIIGETLPEFTFILDVAPNIGVQRSKHRMSGHKLASEELSDLASKRNSFELFDAAFDESSLANEDRFERMGLEFHEKVRAGFLHVASVYPDRCKVIDASNSIEFVANKIWSYFGGR
jgi:dTMP kinase